MSEGISPIFYSIDSSRFSFREYWWGGKSPLRMLSAAIIKLTGRNSGGSTDDPPVESLSPFLIPAEELPADIRASFAPLESELAALGFVEPLFHFIDDRLNFANYYWATYRHKDGHTFARIHCRIWNRIQPPRPSLFPYFVSDFQDRTFLYSSSGRPDTELPSSVQTLRLHKLPTAELWRRHQEKLQSANKPLVPIHDQEGLLASMDAFHAAARDFNLKRGSFQKISAADEKELAIINEVRSAAAARGSANGDVLAEIELLQKSPRRWATSLWLLVISGLAFVAVSSAQSSLKFALMLIPILLFHELGHYLAMHIFKYKNLQMFFIPFFGAAVTGQNYNVAAWKKVVVFLMGPLPGIFLGCALAAAGIFRDNKLVLTAAELLIIVNAFNLLPLLPFDGGRVVGIILFSRHYILDTVFRILTALGILILAFALQSKILMYVGIVSLFAVRTSFKVAKVTEKIRALKMPMLAPDGANIPSETADVIVTELKQTFPKAIASKSLAQHTLTIFETLNSRPPNWLASIFFLGVHAFAFIISLVVGALIVMHGAGGLNLDALAEAPKTEVSSGEVESTGPAASNLDSKNSIALVATFDKHSLAKQAYEKTISRLPENGEGLLFKNVVYLRLPATNEMARAALFKSLETGTTNLFIERSNYFSSFTFQFVLTKKHQQEPWFKEFEDFWKSGPASELIPPWIPPSLKPQDKWTDYKLARHTYNLLTHVPRVKGDSTSDIDDIVAAERIGDSAKVKELQERNRVRREEARKNHFESIKQLPRSEIHPELLAAYMVYPLDTNQLPAWKESRAKMKTLLGTWREADPGIAPFAVQSGYLTRNKLMVTVHVVFEDFARGGSQLLKLLENNGVVGIRYSLTSYSSEDDREAE